MATRFIVLANYERKTLGMPELPYAIVPYPMSGVSTDEAKGRALAVLDVVVKALTTAQIPTNAAAAPAVVRAEVATVVDLDEKSFESINEVFYKLRWTDGLPVVPPTRAKVEAFLAYSDLEPGTVLGVMAPAWEPTTVHHVAVNSVMAGCRPEYFPVVIAGIQAMLDSTLNLYGVQATTNPAGVMLLVNGPIAKELDINGGGNLFGQGWRANGTIGRAVRLCMINIGGGRPGEGYMSTLGSPNKWGSCIGENEILSPWPAFHVERGFDAATSTVTAVATAAPQNVIEMSADPIAILNTLSRALTSAGSNCTLFDHQPMIVIAPVPARQLADGGFDKAAIRKYLWEHGKFELGGYHPTSQKTIREWKASCRHIEDGREVIYPTRTPEDIGIVVGGGDSGPHSAILATFNGTQLVTRAITFRDGTPVLSVEDFRT